jgi:hypothetical protein
MIEAEFDTTSTAAVSVTTAVGGSKKRTAASSRGSSPARSDNGKYNCFCNVKKTQCFDVQRMHCACEFGGVCADCSRITHNSNSAYMHIPDVSLMAMKAPNAAAEHK